MARELGDLPRATECLEELAQVADASEQPERSATLLAAACELRAAIGAPVSPSQRADLDAYLERARSASPAARDAGAVMTAEHAISCASSEATS